MLSQGTADIGVYSNSTTGGVLDERILAVSIPFAFPSYEKAAAAYDAAGGAFVDKVLSEKGLSYLGSIHNGLRQFSNNKRPIVTPADMKNLKIRVMGSELYLTTFRTLGADPIAMSWSEVYTALQQGTIDGQDNGFMTSASTKMYEVQKYFTHINYNYDSFLVMANKANFAKLPDKTKDMLQKIITESCKEIRQQVVDNEDKLIKQFKEEYGVEITELTDTQVQAFKDILKPVIDNYKAKYGEEACKAFGVE
jgi:C4-dicarboxylate transporter DctM subunit